MSNLEKEVLSKKNTISSLNLRLDTEQELHREILRTNYGHEVAMCQSSRQV